ncbi:DUF4277 domain-containing protein [Okeania sp. SIO2B3]|uniref:DUF4277 domain-containing protein n=1 Tax=Okeania sp. SIO2B3 TaxID=2607784 RepID=UPI0025DA230E|nr:DUF4277 domain-containing protein [Okeania sp. SIO2B3]
MPDHLGLVAGIIDEIGIVDKINELIEEKKTEKVSAGKVVKAMILNGITDRPTLRWIFQCFQSVHVFYLQEVKQISNLTNERLHLLKFFPQSCQDYYLLI